MTLVYTERTIYPIKEMKKEKREQHTFALSMNKIWIKKCNTIIRKTETKKKYHTG